MKFKINITMKTLKGLILSIFLFNSSCIPKVDDPAQNIPKTLLGRWEMVEYRVYKTDKGATSPRLLGKFRTGLAYIFYDNNTFDGCIQAGSDWDNAGATGTNGKWNCTTNKPGIWRLSNFKLVNGFLSDDTIVTLETPSQKITQKFTVIIHSDTILDLALEETKDADGGTTTAVANLKKVN
jgi:hypothetical protein